MPISNSGFESIVRKLDPANTLVRKWELTGGVSAQVTALEIKRGDGTVQKVVVRQHGEADLRHNPKIARDEFRLLELVRQAGVAAPTPYLVDDSNTILSSPYVVIEFMEGEVDSVLEGIPDGMDQLATHLARIHTLKAERSDLTFLPALTDRVTTLLTTLPFTPDDSLSESLIRNTLKEVGSPAPLNSPVLLHGDYWPGNVLWKEGQVTAILDWEDAAVGDPLADVANTRLELLWALGVEAMETFTTAYRAIAPIDFSKLSYWELYAALRPAGKLQSWGLEKDIETTMRERHHRFVQQAIERFRE